MLKQGRSGGDLTRPFSTLMTNVVCILKLYLNKTYPIDTLFCRLNYKKNIDAYIYQIRCMEYSIWDNLVPRLLKNITVLCLVQVAASLPHRHHHLSLSPARMWPPILQPKLWPTKAVECSWTSQNLAFQIKYQPISQGRPNSGLLIQAPNQTCLQSQSGSPLPHLTTKSL
jgi:hypothetical protein